jgi:glycosyltransferase involved in cell wall biosynthesis
MISIHMILSPEASGEVVMDLDDEGGETSGGGCRAGFLGLCRALPAFGYDVTALSTFKQQRVERDGVTYLRLPTTISPARVTLAFYDTKPLKMVPLSTLRIASHHTFLPGDAMEWTDVNTAPSAYTVEKMRPVYDTTAPWYVLPNAVGSMPSAEPVPGRVLYHTSPSRGLQHLVAAWPRIRAEVPGATLHVVGPVKRWMQEMLSPTALPPFVPHPTPTRQALRAKDLGNALPAAIAAGGMKFLDILPRRDLLREISEAACFAFPCDTVMPAETFSVSIMECCKASVPVVLRPMDALSSIYQGAVQFAEIGDAFADAVSRVLVDRGHATDLARRGRELAARYTFENMAATLDQIIKKELRT